MKAIHTITAAATLAVAALSTAGDASAVVLSRQFASNPTSLCQGALPAFETQIRKRPLAVVNEGSTSSFVTCSFISQGNWNNTPNLPNPTAVQVYFGSILETPVTINCTGVSGFNTSTTSQYIPKTITVASSGFQSSATWSAADFTGAPAIFPSGLFSISCNLPAGAGINDMYVRFSEDVGS